MSIIFCPECGSKISNKAKTCPHCGYTSENSLLPISVQENCDFIPCFQYEIEPWNSNCEIIEISYNDNKTLVEYFGKFENIKHTMPEIANAIQQMAKKENILVAKLDPYIKTLIKTGQYKFCKDKAGNILPTLRDSSGFVHNCRLENMQINTNVAQSLSNLSSQAMMVQIMNKIDMLENSIKVIDIDLQNDRIAKAEASWLKLLQARKIQDTFLRNIQVLNIINDSIEARAILMKNFETKLNSLLSHNNSSELEKLTNIKFKPKVEAQKCMNALVSITNLVRVECEAYLMQGEYESAKESLKQFKTFIETNKLNDKEVLKLINEYVEFDCTNIVNDFIQISGNIEKLEIHFIENSKNILMIEE